MAEARGGLGRRGLLRPGAAAGFRDAQAAAAAILWGRLKLRKRLLHLLVSAAATFPARVRRRRGFHFLSSRHRAGVRSSGKLLPTRSTRMGGMGGKGRRAGLAAELLSAHPPPSPRGRGPRSRPRSLSGAPKRAPQPRGPASRAAPRSGSSSAGPPPLNVLASELGRGGALTDRSANGDAVPTSAGVDKTAPGGGASGRRSPPKGATAMSREYLDVVADYGVNGPQGGL